MYIKGKTYMDAFIQGDIKIFDIHDYIEEWHKGNSNMPIYEFLGMTEDEYAKFVESETALIDIVYNRVRVVKEK